MPPVGAFIVDVLDGRADRRLPQRRKHSLSRCPQSDLNCWGDCPAGGGRAAAHCAAFYAKDSALLHALNAFAWSDVELLTTYTVPADIATRNLYCRDGRKPQSDDGMNPRVRKCRHVAGKRAFKRHRRRSQAFQRTWQGKKARFNLIGLMNGRLCGRPFSSCQHDIIRHASLSGFRERCLWRGLLW